MKHAEAARVAAGLTEKATLMTARRTIVVAGPLAADAARLELARARCHGTMVTTMSGVAARLAGGFLRSVDADALSAAIGVALLAVPPSGLGDLEPIRDLPGLRVALTHTARCRRSPSSPTGPSTPRQHPSNATTRCLTSCRSGLWRFPARALPEFIIDTPRRRQNRTWRKGGRVSGGATVRRS